MELKEQLEKIDQLKTDKYMKMVLLAISSINSLGRISEKLLEKYEDENSKINRKISDFRDDLLDAYDEFTDKFYDDTVAEICEFCDFYIHDNYVNELIYEYSCGHSTLDELIADLKKHITDNQ